MKKHEFVQKYNDSNCIDITSEPRSSSFIDKTGLKINKLKIIKLFKVLEILDYKRSDGSNKSRVKVFWECQCDCGEICIKGNDVLNNKKRNFSCGCFRKQRVLETKLKSDEEHRYGALMQARARYRIEAERRNYSFDLSKEEFIEIVNKPCYYCGKENSQYFTHHITKVKHEFSGIDRVDNSKGYSADNVVSCCRTCNTKKNSIDPEMVKKLYKLMVEKGIINE